jgi:chorismate mutase/prephenate dehydrogenase
MGMNLKDMREALDRIDNEIVTLLAKRLSLIPYIAEHKMKNGAPRTDPEREREVLAKGAKLGEKVNLRKEYVEDIFKRIIEESHYIERKMMGK